MENWEPKLCILFFSHEKIFQNVLGQLTPKNFSLATHPDTFARFFEGIQYR